MDFLDLTLETIEENLALDEILLIDVEEGSTGPLLRLWESPRHVVVLGASGRIQEDVDLELCKSDHVGVSRRSSGGGTVVLGPGALNFTVVLSRNFAPGLDAVNFAQQFVLEQLAEALRRDGLGVTVEGSGDLVLEGKKISGSAQRRLKHHFLVHATVLYDFDLPRIWRYTRLPSRQPAYRQGRSHQEFVTNLGVSRSRLEAALKLAWRISNPPVAPGRISLDRIGELVATKFGREDWIHRL